MRILIISDSYPPEVRSAAQLMKDLAEGLVARGHEVTVVTSYPTSNLATASAGGLAFSSRENGVRVLRPKVMQHHRVPFVVRGLAQLILPHIFWNVVKKECGGRLDAVVVHSPPLPLAYTARKARKHFGARIFLNVHDFFPQNAVDLGILTQPLLVRFFEQMERRAYRDADMLVVPSESHKIYLHDKRGISINKISVVPHWIDPAPFLAAKDTGRFRRQYHLEGKLVFLFAGVLGPSQGLEIVLECAARAREFSDVRFLFVGDGTQKEKLAAIAQEKKLLNVQFEPFVSSEEYPNLVKEMDIGLLCLTSANTTPAVPAKLMGYMAGGIPVAAFLHAQSDGHAILRDAQCGLSAPSNDIDAAYKVIQSLAMERSVLSHYGENGKRYLLEHFTKDVCVRQWEEIFSRNG